MKLSETINISDHSFAACRPAIHHGRADPGLRWSLLPLTSLHSGVWKLFFFSFMYLSMSFCSPSGVLIVLTGFLNPTHADARRHACLHPRTRTLAYVHTCSRRSTHARTRTNTNARKHVRAPTHAHMLLEEAQRQAGKRAKMCSYNDTQIDGSG